MNCIAISLSNNKKDKILALGAQSKGSLCFINKNKAYVCESFGDLSDLENFRRFQKYLRRMRDRIKADPETIACDLHAEYISTKYAQELAEREGWGVEGIQHHEAHIASCIADNEIKGRVIGVVFDGTGFGLDGNIWGGEFFVGSLNGFKRAAHLKYIAMPGGEAAVKEPWRMAVSYLYNIYGLKFFKPGIDFTDKLDKKSVSFIARIIDKKINSPLTSSMGRLFDAVSSIAGICSRANYEGAAAVELEKAIEEQAARTTRSKEKVKYKFRYIVKKDIIEIDWVPLIIAVVKDLQLNKIKSEISLKFHNSVSQMIKDVCVLLRKKYKLNKVCLSGGVFQNKYLTTSLRPILEAEGFGAYFHKRLPAHDGNIALGQAVLTSAK